MLGQVWNSSFRGIEILSGTTTLSNFCLLSSEKEFVLKGNNLLPLGAIILLLEEISFKATLWEQILFVYSRSLFKRNFGCRNVNENTKVVFPVKMPKILLSVSVSLRMIFYLTFSSDTIWPPAETCLRTCAAWTNHHAHAQSLIRAFALHRYILQYLMIMWADSESPDQTAHLRSLIWAFAIRICPKTRFRLARPLSWHTIAMRDLL